MGILTQMNKKAAISLCEIEKVNFIIGFLSFASFLSLEFYLFLSVCSFEVRFSFLPALFLY